VLEEPDYTLIEHFLHHIKHVIASDDESLYQYIMKWIASILQVPTFKNKVMLLIQGRQGSGKTLFTNVICHLLGEYGLPNVKDSQNITGHFNAVIENIKLAVLNELVSSDDTNAHADYNAFKTIISEDVIDITRKGQDTREAMNILNLIITTNYMNALRFNGDDRRICPITSNNTYARPNDDDPEFQTKESERELYFDPIYEEIDNPEFYPTLFTYLMSYDTTGYKPAKFPITQARKDIVESNKSPIELTITEYISNFIDGISGDEAYKCYNRIRERDGYRGVFSKPKFLSELKKWSVSKKGTTRTDRTLKWYLNDDGKAHFKSAIDELTLCRNEESEIMLPWVAEPSAMSVFA
jgi:phage/plasmid-associated DNA primase